MSKWEAKFVIIELFRRIFVQALDNIKYLALLYCGEYQKFDDNLPDRFQPVYTCWVVAQGHKQMIVRTSECQTITHITQAGSS